MTVADLKRQFRFIGASDAYHFLDVVNQPVPPYEEWLTDARCPARKRRSSATTKRSPARTTA